MYSIKVNAENSIIAWRNSWMRRKSHNQSKIKWEAIYFTSNMKRTSMIMTQLLRNYHKNCKGIWLMKRMVDYFSRILMLLVFKIFIICVTSSIKLHFKLNSKFTTHSYFYKISRRSLRLIWLTTMTRISSIIPISW